DEGKILGDAQQPGRERLVVVHDVEVAEPVAQQACGAQTEGARFGEDGGPHGGDLEDVDPVAVLARLRRAERIVVAVEIETGYLRERHAGVELGVRLAGEHLDGVSLGDEFATEMANVDPLAPTMRLAPVGQQSYA